MDKRTGGVLTLLTPDQVADRLQVEPSTVKRWLRQGKLQGVKPGKEWRITESQLSGFIGRENFFLNANNEIKERQTEALFTKSIDKLFKEFDAETDRLYHAITYALNAIEEHQAGSNIDWQDVTNVLKKAIGEVDNAGQ